MRKFVKGGVLFTAFESDGVNYLCTGNPTGKFQFNFAGETADYYTVVGATSVVSGGIDATTDELYNKWLEATEFYRSIGIQF